MIQNKLYVNIGPIKPSVPLATVASHGSSMVFTKKRLAAGSLAIRRSKPATGVAGPLILPRPKLAVVKKVVQSAKPATSITHHQTDRTDDPPISSVKGGREDAVAKGNTSRATAGSGHSKMAADSKFTNHNSAGHHASLFTGNPNIPVIARGVVNPISEEVFSGDSFDTLGISAVLNTQLLKVGCLQMTVVQQRGIPPIAGGRDVLLKSQTGSGKTLTYVVPIIDALMTTDPPVRRHHGVLAVIIVPTRELAQQTYDWIDKLCKACISIVPGILRGGENRKAEKDCLKKGVNILVATPGRLLDHIDSTERLKLAAVRYLVLDEADRMMDMGYEKSIAAIIEAIGEAKLHGDLRRIQLKKDAREERNAFGKRNAAGFEELGQDEKRRKDKANEKYVNKQLRKVNRDDAMNTSTDDDDDDNSDNDSNSNDDNIHNDDSDEEDRPLEDIDEVTDITTTGNTVTPITGDTLTKVSSASAPSQGPGYQTVMLSATLTEQVQRLAGVNLRDPEIIDVSGCGSVSLASCGIAMPRLRANVFMVVPPKLRLVTLAAFVLAKCMYGQLKKMLIFMASQDMVDYHAALFTKVLSSYGSLPAEAEEKLSVLESEANYLLDNISNTKKKKVPVKEKQPKKEDPVKTEPLFDFMQLRGNMSQEDRTKVFNRFKAASSGVLLCTDVASRGLDLPAVTWIVQYTAPGNVTDFVHRVGRTSRADSIGSAMLMLAPSEVDFITKLDEQQIRLDEVSYRDTLKAFTQPPRRRDPLFRTPRSSEEGASCMQGQFEKLLLSNSSIKKLATDGYLSFIRAYASYPRDTKQIFNYKGLHQGHYAKSFALRDAPSVLGAGAASKSQMLHRSKKESMERKERTKMKGVRAQKRGAVPRMSTMSEFDSGLDDLAARLSKKKMEQTKKHNHIRTNKGGKILNKTTKMTIKKKTSTKGKSTKKKTSTKGKSTKKKT